jgi:hypothetical protein
MAECQYIGADVDPRRVFGSVPTCGHATLAGKSYCHDHYWVVYKKGSSNLKGATKAIEKEIAEIQHLQEIQEIVNE